MEIEKLAVENYVKRRDLIWELTWELTRAKKTCGKLSSSHALYQTWSGMINRCYNPHNTGFSLYGARGIEVCDRWFNFENFVKDMGKKPGTKLSIDRIDGELGYFPEKCRWASRKEQAANVRPDRRAEMGFIHSNLMRGIFKNWSGEVNS